MSESEKVDFKADLKAMVTDKCESCKLRPIYKQRKWCKRCIDRYDRRLRTSFEIQSAISRIVPLDYLSASVEDFDEPTKGELQRWNIMIDNLFITGESGTGKTRSIFALLKKCIEGGYSAARYEFTSLCSEIRDTFNRRSKETENSIVKKIADLDVLFLDDLGISGKTTDFDYEIFYRILDARMMDCLPTVIVSNRGLADIGEIFDRRIASRLKTFSIIKFNGEDKRQAHL